MTSDVPEHHINFAKGSAWAAQVNLQCPEPVGTAGREKALRRIQDTKAQTDLAADVDKSVMGGWVQKHQMTGE